jgi:cell division protein FtsQ
MWILLVGGAIALLAFTNKANNDSICQEVIVSINHDEDNYFVEEKDVLQMAYQRGDSLKGQSLASIDVFALETIFNTHPSIQKTDVYKSIEGKLYIQVKQRRPIARIVNYMSESYYIDNYGKLMPLSENYAARVPVFCGKIPNSYGANYGRSLTNEFLSEDSLNMNFRILNSIYHLAAYIDSSEFWKAQIEQVMVVDNDFVLIPKVGDNKIIFGDAKNTRKKFEKLMLFYQEGLSKTGWNKYSVINLRFENQVVCTKANVPLVASIVKMPMPIASAATEPIKVVEEKKKEPAVEKDVKEKTKDKTSTKKASKKKDSKKKKEKKSGKKNKKKSHE